MIVKSTCIGTSSGGMRLRAQDDEVQAMDERETENYLKQRAEEIGSHGGPESLGTGELLQQIGYDTRELMNLQVELAKEEARLDLNAEFDLAKGVAVAAACTILGINMLIISAVFAFAPKLAWVVALIVGITLLILAAIAGFYGWKRAERNPMHVARSTLMEDVEWAKKQIKP